MHRDATRVVYNDRPYLVIQRDDGSVARAYGPFTPGTEPALAECSPDNEVRDEPLLATLGDLLAISPSLPASEDSLAGS